MPKHLTLSHMITGFLLHAETRRLNSHMIDTYKYAYNKLTARIDGKTPIKSITVAEISVFLSSLDTLSNKTLSNVHAALSTMWN